MLVKDKSVVLYPKDTEKWKQFTTLLCFLSNGFMLCCIPKILKNESNSQHWRKRNPKSFRCVVSQRYWKMKAIHNTLLPYSVLRIVVLYPKDTEKWKQFTTSSFAHRKWRWLCCIPKILKNESNSQLIPQSLRRCARCVVSQRYWKMKAIHNYAVLHQWIVLVVLYPKDTEKWKQFTTSVQH